MRKNKFRRRLKPKTKLMITISCLLVVVILVFLFFNNYVNPVIITISEAKVQSMTAQSVNSAVQSVINNSNVYDEIIDIQTDSEGNITTFQVKSILINKLAREIGKTAQQNLELVGSQGIDIPLGTLTGIPMFVGTGPNIYFKVQPIGTLSSSFASEFVSAGINQTNHRIYMNVQASVSMVLPTASRTIKTNTQILICESIIVGKVPDTYLNSDSLDEMMNLIPG
ncbi:MAG: sporulation protein YunB [Clostridia bacterium]|nr:sporulation protein YunB [Clostridia bacterium]